MGWWSSTWWASSIRCLRTAALSLPEGSRGPMTSPRWSWGGSREIPVMEAPDCTAMCRKEAAGWTTIPASLAAAAKVGSWKRSVISWMDWSPSMDPPEWERIFFSAKGRSLSSRATMLHR